MGRSLVLVAATTVEKRNVKYISFQSFPDPTHRMGFSFRTINLAKQESTFLVLFLPVSVSV